MLTSLTRLQGGIPVLMYHRLRDDGHPLSVPPARFEAQLRWIERVYRPVTLSDLLDGMERGEPPRGALAITFDDGYLDNYTEAFPRLKALGIPATFFVTTGNVGERRYFWWDRVRLGLRSEPEILSAWPELGEQLAGRSRETQIQAVTEALKEIPQDRALALMETLCEPLIPPEDETMTWDQLAEMADAGMEIGSHTVSHPILTRLSAAGAAAELAGSRAVLEERLGRPVRHFAYPNGQPADLSGDLARMVREAGYRSACTTVAGRVTRGSDPYLLPRIGVYGNTTLPLFVAKLAGLRVPGRKKG